MIENTQPLQMSSYPQMRSDKLLSTLLLLLLSHLSRVRVCVTPQMAAHQAPPSLGFSRQEHWSGLPFPSPMQESESEVTQSCLTPSDPMDCSPPGSSIHGIFKARVLEWGAIAFSQQRWFVANKLHSASLTFPGKFKFKGYSGHISSSKFNFIL